MAWLAWRLTRRGSIAWAAVLGFSITAMSAGYIAAYPSAADRRLFASSVGDNPAFRALYGPGVALDTPGGFVQWRYGTGLALLAGIWGLLAATRLLRGEEESGRVELISTGTVRPPRLLAIQLGTLAGGFVLIGGVLAVGAVAGGLPVGGSAMLGAMTALSGLVFATMGAVASQVAVTRRQAAAWTGLVLAASFVLRTAAGAASDVRWLVWVTPLGWAGRTQPLTGPSLVPFALLVAACLVFAGLAVALRARRDLGASVLAIADAGRPSLRLLGSSFAFTVRSNRAMASAWGIGLGSLMLLFGLLVPDVVAWAREDVGLSAEIAIGGARMTSADGLLGFLFVFMMVVLSVLAVTLVGAMHEEESSGRLDNLLARPVTRARWFGARVAGATLIVAAVAACSGAAAWAGAAVRGADVTVGGVAAATVNTLPVTVFFGGLTLLVFAAAPRLTSGLGIGLAVGLFLLDFIGENLDAPGWLLDLSPFHHVAAVPAVDPAVGPAIALVSVGVVLGVAGLGVFRSRDLQPE
ncbi:MAG: hypothetical protein IPM45_00240 [Acidimicrobiales bacterium]|nr:hypothetical protein [Acidimicrobiales bacterium]